MHRALTVHERVCGLCSGEGGFGEVRNVVVVEDQEVALGYDEYACEGDGTGKCDGAGNDDGWAAGGSGEGDGGD